MIPGILDKFENEIGLLTDCIEGIAIEERNGMCEAEITYPIFSPNWNELKRGNIIVADVNDTLKNQKLRIYKASKPLSGRIKVYARHIFFDLARDIIEEFELTNASCEYALNELFRRSQFSQAFKGYSDIINAQDYKMSTINLIKSIGGVQGSILDTYGTGAEILRDNRNIHILNRRGHDNGVTIEYSKNMTGLNIEFDDSNLITRIKAIAKYNDENNNEIIVKSNPEYVDSPLINNYETPFIQEIDFSGEFENDETPTPAKLRELAEKYFRDNKCDQVKTNIKVEFIPLSRCLGYEDIQDKISLCDTVTIKDYRYNLDTQAKVIKTHYNFLNDRYEKMELGDPKTTLGDLVGGGNSGPGITSEETSKVPGINDSSFPNTLPQVPTLSSKLYGFDTIELTWTFEAKTYYTYELYASKVKDFEPNVFDLLFKGNASTFLHSAKPSEVWYYKIRAINTHGRATAFSNQIAVETVKIENLENYVANAAIGDALIGELNLGRGWFGQLRGNYIDAKQLSVTNGNGKRTLDIDSFGNVTLLPTNFKILVEGKEESVISQSRFNVAFNSIKEEITTSGGGNLISNSGFDALLKNWVTFHYSWENLNNMSLTIANDGEWILEGTKAIQVRCATSEENGQYGVEQTIKVKKFQDYTFSCLVAQHRADNLIFICDSDWNRLGQEYTYESQGFTGGKDIRKWKKVIVSFNSGDRTEIRLRMAMIRSSSNGHVWFCQPMLNEGKMTQAWCEKPASSALVSQELTSNSIINKVQESINNSGTIESSSMIFDKSGLRVESISSNTKTNMTSDGFKIIRNSDNKVLFEARDGKLYIDGDFKSDYTIHANGGIYTGQAIRGTGDNFTAVASNGNAILRSDKGNCYLQTVDEVKITGPADPNTYKNLRAHNVIANNKVYSGGNPVGYIFEESVIPILANANVRQGSDGTMNTSYYIHQFLNEDADIENGVDIGTQISLLVKAFQEQQKEIENLKAKLNG